MRRPFAQVPKGALKKKKVSILKGNLKIYLKAHSSRSAGVRGSRWVMIRKPAKKLEAHGDRGPQTPNPQTQTSSLLQTYPNLIFL
jgi:hypothetical protein